MNGQQLILALVSGLFLLVSDDSLGEAYRVPAFQSPVLKSDSHRPFILATTAPISESQFPEPHSGPDFSLGIKRLNPIDLPWISPKHGLRADTNFCIFSSNGAYRVILNNQAQDSRFYLENNRFKLPISIYFNDQPGINGRRLLTEGTMLSGLTTPNHQSICKDLSANLSVVILSEDLNAAQAGHYRGQFLLEISPE